MQFSLDVHAQAVRDRERALHADAAQHRLARSRERCSWPAHAVRRAAVLLGIATAKPNGCGGRRRPRVADAL
jgi:hypothetical protein